MAIDKQRGIRLSTFIKYLNIRYNAFSDKVGTSNRFVSQLINGHSNLTGEMVYRIGKVYPELNKDWLLSGEGEMLLPVSVGGAIVSESEHPYVPMSPFEQMEHMMERYDERILALEKEVRLLKEEVKRLKP